MFNVRWSGLKVNVCTKKNQKIWNNVRQIFDLATSFFFYILSKCLIFYRYLESKFKTNTLFERFTFRQNKTKPVNVLLAAFDTSPPISRETDQNKETIFSWPGRFWKNLEFHLILMTVEWFSCKILFFFLLLFQLSFIFEPFLFFFFSKMVCGFTVFSIIF